MYKVYCCFSETYDERNQYFFKKSSEYRLNEHKFIFHKLSVFLEKLEQEETIFFPPYSVLLLCPNVQETLGTVFWNKLHRLSQKLKNVKLFIMPPMAFLDHLKQEGFLKCFWRCWDFVERHTDFSLLPNHDIFLNQEEKYLEKMSLLFERVLTLTQHPVLPQVEHIRNENQAMILSFNQELFLDKEKVFGFRLAARDGKFLTAKVKKPKALSLILESKKTRILQVEHERIQTPYYVAYGMELFYQEPLYNVYGIPLLPFTNYQGTQAIASTQVYELCNQWSLRCVQDKQSQALHGLFLERPLFQLGARVQAKDYLNAEGEQVGLHFTYLPFFKEEKSYLPLLNFQLQADIPKVEFPSKHQYFYIRFRSFGHYPKRLYFNVPMQYPEQKPKGAFVELALHSNVQECVFEITKAHREQKAFSLWIEDRKKDSFSLPQQSATEEELIILEMGAYPA